MTINGLYGEAWNVAMSNLMDEFHTTDTCLLEEIAVAYEIQFDENGNRIEGKSLRQLKMEYETAKSEYENDPTEENEAVYLVANDEYFSKLEEEM